MAHLVSETPVKASFVVLVLFVFGASCNQGTVVSTSVRDYYFDQAGCTGAGMIYVYEKVGDLSLPPEHWHFRYSPGFTGNYFHATMYTPTGDLVQRTKERIERDFSQLLSMNLYYVDQTDSIVEIDVQVNEEKVFAFGSVDSIPRVQSQIEYLDTSVDSVRVILTKTRELVGRGEYAYNGELIPTITIATFEQLETETVGFTTSQWQGIEIYGQDIGLLYYKKDISDMMTLEYELVDRVPFGQFKWEENER